MIAPLLKTALEPVVARHRLIRYLQSMAAWLAAFTLLALGLRIYHERFAVPAVLLFVVLFIIGRLVARRTNRWEPDYRQIARGIEQQHPNCTRCSPPPSSKRLTPGRASSAFSSNACSSKSAPPAVARTGSTPCLSGGCGPGARPSSRCSSHLPGCRIAIRCRRVWPAGSQRSWKNPPRA